MTRLSQAATIVHVLRDALRARAHLPVLVELAAELRRRTDLIPLADLELEIGPRAARKRLARIQDLGRQCEREFTAGHRIAAKRAWSELKSFMPSAAATKEELTDPPKAAEPTEPKAAELTEPTEPTEPTAPTEPTDPTDPEQPTEIETPAGELEAATTTKRRGKKK